MESLSVVEMWLEVGLLLLVFVVGEDAERRSGGRGKIEGEVGEVLVRIGRKCGLKGVEEDDVEMGESEGVVWGEGERSVVLRLVGLLGRGEGVRIVVAEGGGMVWLVVGGRVVCRRVWVFDLVLVGMWWELREMW